MSKTAEKMTYESEMHDIEMMCADFARARSGLDADLAIVNAEINNIKQGWMPRFRKGIQELKALESEIKASIEAASYLFEKPRTRTFNGIKVGINKGKGKLAIDNESKCIERIKKNLSDLQEQLIITVEKANKKAIQTLSATDLKKLGVRIVDTEDQIIIKAMGSDLEKQLEALSHES